MNLPSFSLASLPSDWDSAKYLLDDDVAQLTTAISAGWSKQHNIDGTHSDITADSLTLNNKKVGEIVNLDFNPSRFTTSNGHSTWTVTQTSTSYLRYVQIGHLVTLQFAFPSSVVAGSPGNPTALKIAVPEFNLSNIPNTDQVAVFTFQVGGATRWIESTAGAESDRGLGDNRIRSTDTGGLPTPGAVIELHKSTSGAALASYSFGSNLEAVGHISFLVR